MSVMDVVLVLVAYLLGAIPFGILVAKVSGLGLDDLRTRGSGNIGATNVTRVLGKRAGAVTLAADIAKGAAAVGLAKAFAAPEVAILAASAAVLGHVFPVYLRFRGGKGVATGFGVLTVLHFPTALVTFLVWLAAAKISKVSAVGALASYAALPAVAWWLGPGGWFLPFVCGLSVLILVRHVDNVRRLIRERRR